MAATMSVAPCSISDTVTPADGKDLLSKSISELIDIIHNLKKNYEEQIGVLENRVNDLQTIIREEGDSKAVIQKQLENLKGKEESILKPLNTKPSVKDIQKPLVSGKITVDVKPKAKENNGKRPAPELNPVTKKPRIPPSTVLPTTSTTRQNTGLSNIVRTGNSNNSTVQVLPVSTVTAINPSSSGPAPKVTKPVCRINKPLAGKITSVPTTVSNSNITQTRIPTRIANRVIENPQSKPDRKDIRSITLLPSVSTLPKNTPASKVVTPIQESSLDRPEIPSELVSPVPLETPSTHQDNIQQPTKEVQESISVQVNVEEKTEPATECVTYSVIEIGTECRTDSVTESVTEHIIESVNDPVTKSLTEPVTELITKPILETFSPPQVSNNLESNNLDEKSVSSDEIPKEMEIIPNDSHTGDNSLSQLPSLNEPNLNESPLKETETSIDLSDPQIEEKIFNLSETETLKQPVNFSTIPESLGNTENNSESSNTLASPKPINTAITSSPTLFMSPSLFGDENLFRTEFKNSVLDFLLPSPLSTPAQKPINQEPLPMDEDCSNFSFRSSEL